MGINGAELGDKYPRQKSMFILHLWPQVSGWGQGVDLRNGRGEKKRRKLKVSLDMSKC